MRRGPDGAGLPTSLAHRLVCVPPLSERHVLFGVPVSTLFVKLLVSFWLVGGLAEGQKIVTGKSSKKVLVGELLRFSTAFVNKKLCSYCYG